MTNKHDSVIEIKDTQPSIQNVYLFGLPLHNLSSTMQFMTLAIAVFIFYVVYGYLLELIFRLDGMQPHGWFLTLVQFGFYSIFSFLQIYLSGMNIGRKIPIQTYCVIATLTVGTMGFSNSSMGYLNFPTQVIFKSCKLIPVMIGSVIILKKTYTMSKVMACVCMSIGLIWFTLADSSVQPNFSLKGVTFVSLALLCDAIIGNVQEGAMKKYNEHPTSVILYSYLIGFLIIFVGLIISRNFEGAFQFASQHPWEVYGRGAVLSVAGFCGVQVVLMLVSQYGALTAVTVTTFRKALSIIVSFLFFEKPFTIQYVWGGLLVTVGIYLNAQKKINFGSSSFYGFIVQLQQLHLRIKKWQQPKLPYFSIDEKIYADV